MNRNQNERIRNLERPVPGCLGSMINLFDLNTSVGGNRLLTEKPHYEGYPVSRSESNVSTSCVVDDHMLDKVTASKLGKPLSNRKPNGTPIKMLMAQEMSKEEVPKKGSPSLVAKLMGLDDLPQRDQLSSASCRSNVRGSGSGSRSRSHSGSLEFVPKEHGDVHQYKSYGGSPQKGSNYKESESEKKMDLVREKFMEAKRLSTDEKLRHSKQFQDALEVLSSHKDSFLELLQEPSYLFSQHHDLQSVPPRPDSKRITILKPSKLVDGHKLPSAGKEYGNQTNGSVWDRFSEAPNQPTRIVVLKPDFGRPLEARTVSSSPSLKPSNDDGFYGDLEDSEPKERTPSISESSSGHRRDETLLSSVFSNGYIGDESSFSKSEVYYAAGNLSDSEASPTSRYSWDYINRFGSPYSSSSFSHASCSPESSVCREAKKRLSERWAMMSLNGSVQEQRHVRRHSSTLGEMLALSDLKKSIESKENGRNTSDLNKNNAHDADNSPKKLVRGKSPTLSSTEFLKGKKDHTNDLTTEKGQKSSLVKGNVSRLLLFSRNGNSSKQKYEKFDDEAHQSSKNIGDDGSRCINDIVVKDLPEVSGNANENPDQPSPVSVLELQFKDDAHTTGCSSIAKLNKIGLDPNKYNLIDKSPPIGSIARTLSCDYSAVTPVPSKTSRKPLSPEEEEQEFFLYLQALLSAAGINNEVQSDSVITRWHSAESPLDPSLRDKYMNLSDKEPYSKRRRQRSFQKLVFDCVNEALSSGTHKRMGKVPMDSVWSQMKEWISREERCVWDDDGEDEDGCGIASLVVERAVRKEVAGQVWMEHLKLKTDDIKKEIEGKLVEQLVDEFVLELTGRVILSCTP